MSDLHLHKENLSASFPALLTALAYGLVLFGLGDALGFTGREMKVLLQVEFLVIHSFPFLCLFAWMGGEGARHPAMKGNEGNPKAWKAAFWGFLAMYILAAFSMGWMGPLYFLVATAATYPLFLGWGRNLPPFPAGVTTTVRSLPLRFSPKDREEWLRLGSSWAACFILYLVWIGLFDLSNNVDEWRAEASTYQAGLWYFLSMGLLELFGFHGKTARWIKDVQEKSRAQGGGSPPPP